MPELNPCCGETTTGEGLGLLEMIGRWGWGGVEATAGLCVRREARRASWLNTSSSVVFARPLPVLPGCSVWDVGADLVSTIAGAAGGSADGCGGTEAVRGCWIGEVGVGVSGLAELGRFVQASSSNPLDGGGTEPALTDGDDMGLSNEGDPVLLIVSEALEIAFASTLVGGIVLLGVGRPLL